MTSLKLLLLFNVNFSKSWIDFNFRNIRFHSNKRKEETNSINNGFKSNEPLSCRENLDSRNQIVSEQDEMKNFKCPSCQYRCSLQDNLDAHIASVHKEKKSFKCESCNYTFSQIGHLKTHIRSVHEGKKPFKCDFCNFTFLKKVT